MSWLAFLGTWRLLLPAQEVDVRTNCLSTIRVIICLRGLIVLEQDIGVRVLGSGVGNGMEPALVL